MKVIKIELSTENNNDRIVRVTSNSFTIDKNNSSSIPIVVFGETSDTKVANRRILERFHGLAFKIILRTKSNKCRITKHWSDFFTSYQLTFCWIFPTHVALDCRQRMQKDDRWSGCQHVSKRFVLWSPAFVLELYRCCDQKWTMKEKIVKEIISSKLRKFDGLNERLTFMMINYGWRTLC